MAYGDCRKGERWSSAALTGVAVAALGYALLSGLAWTPLRPRTDEQLLAFNVAPPLPPPPPEPPPPPHPRTAEREGASAPPNIKSRATPVEVPPPPIRLPPPPIATAPVASTGFDASSGAALVAGPGTGAGGVGNGTGSGARGNGSGAGGTPARVISRPLRLGDLPEDVVRTVLSGERRYDVEAHYTVTPQGRVANCHITRSSGAPALDAATCQAMMAKLRYRPERDAVGRAVAVETDGYQTWESHTGYAPGED